MKVICTQENLKLGLAVVGRIASSSNTLPILGNFFIRTENGVLKISSTNLEIAITTEVRCKIEQEGGVTVVGKTINELINSLPNKNITLTKDSLNLKVETENYQTVMKTLPVEEFPLIPLVETGKGIEVDARSLKISLDQVVFAASTNQTQPEISGVFISFDNGVMRLAATDRYRLAEKSLILKNNPDSFEAIIPQKTILEISRIVGNSEGVVGLVFSDTQVSFSFNGTQIISRLVDGQYPDYKQIIPSEFNIVVVVGREALIGALKTVSVFSQASKSVKLSISPKNQTLLLLAESSELGRGEADIRADIKGGDVTLILNHFYLIDCLTSIETENVVIKIVDDNSPSLIVPEGKEDYMYLVMPIKS